MTAVATPPVKPSAPSGVLVIDKPGDWTSHDVVAKVRRLLKTKKVGHTGTLDPMGTGLLPICVGDATKLAGYAQMADKIYRVTMRLGITTDTQDRTGEITATAELDPQRDWPTLINEQFIAHTGEIDQIPPMYAAIKVDGEALYKKARRGETVVRKPRRLTIYGITDVVFDLPEVSFTLACSKGTYVRTLAADVGDALGVGAHLTMLRRVACGGIDLSEAVTLAQLEAAVERGTASELLCSEDYLLGDLPLLRVSEYTSQRMVQGIAPHVSEWAVESEAGNPGISDLPPNTLCRVYGERRGFFALVETGSDRVHPARIRRIVKPNFN